MSREIKFRACDLDNKKYEYDIAIRPINKIIGIEIFNNEMYPVEFRGIVEEYTGLKDKNGKEIYEGDILSIPARKDKLNTKLYTVEWHKVHARFNFANKNGEFGEINIGKIKRAEVIGNIHEIPELLGGK